MLIISVFLTNNVTWRLIFIGILYRRSVFLSYRVIVVLDVITFSPNRIPISQHNNPHQWKTYSLGDPVPYQYHILTEGLLFHRIDIEDERAQ